MRIRIALALSALVCAQADSPLSPRQHGDFGHYTLALTWQPGFCAGGRCAADQNHNVHIGLHGLWASRPHDLIARNVPAPKWWSRGCDFYHHSDAALQLDGATVRNLERVMPQLHPQPADTRVRQACAVLRLPDPALLRHRTRSAPAHYHQPARRLDAPPRRTARSARRRTGRIRSRVLYHQDRCPAAALQRTGRRALSQPALVHHPANAAGRLSPARRPDARTDRPAQLPGALAPAGLAVLEHIAATDARRRTPWCIRVLPAPRRLR